jgi:EAL domain-containing protein (putative c-di-GMP-specific phosphodiesterase class I)/GGDEF domain-containing protein
MTAGIEGGARSPKLASVAGAPRTSGRLRFIQRLKAAPDAGLEVELLPGLLAKSLAVAAICLLLLGSTAAVYFTGGTSYALLHVVYIPVILTGSLLGIESGIAVGIAAGLLLGPLMPQNVDSGQMQQTANWLIRLGFLASAGLVAGAVMHLVRAQQAKVQWLLYRSTGTDLPNRQALVKAIEDIHCAKASPNRYTLVLARINNFDPIINALGTALGDQLLQALAQRILELQPQAERVYDLRAHKLGLLLAQPHENIEAHVRRIQQLPDEPVLVDGIPVYVDLAFGSVALDASLGSGEAVIQRANIALHEAHERGHVHVAHTPQSDALRMRNQRLLAQIPRAIRRSELLLEYQPKIDLRHRCVIGAEALVRWQHPHLGRVAPGEFIPLIEETGLVHPLTRWVFRTAIGEIASLRRAGHDLNVAINLSPRNLQDPDLFAYLGETIAAYELPAHCIELEITESAILHDPGKLREGLSELRRLGMKISIDDFGTGYTSLSYLTELPIDCLKIDQVFVRALLDDPRKRNIVRAIITMAHDLGLSTVAEGIENQQTADALAQIGCDIGQGFLFSRPLSPSKLQEWLTHSGALCRVD